MKILVGGWFSFESMGATAGDLITCDLVVEWLDTAGLEYDVAFAPPFQGGINWKTTDPKTYSHVIFVCGPLGNGDPSNAFLKHFESCRLIGLNLSMLDPLETWNPFALLLERDSTRTARPDISFLAHPKVVPVTGIVLVDPQKEYKAKAMHRVANEAIARLSHLREMARVEIDTRLDLNRTGLRSPAEVETLIARMDVVLTTRLHGMVLAIKNKVPAVVIDPIAGGAKILQQAKTIGWPMVFTTNNLDDQVLQRAFDYCLTTEGRNKVQECRDRALSLITSIKDTLITSIKNL